MRTGIGILGVGDTDHFTIQVKECTAGVSRIDGAVSLDQIHRLLIDRYFTVQCTDATGGQRECQLAQRITDRQDIVSDIHLIRITENDRNEVIGFDLQDGQVIALIVTDEYRVILFSIVCGDLDRRGAFHYVIVGHDIAVVREDKTGTGGRRRGLITIVVVVDGSGDTDCGVYIGGVDL